ncbi:MAG: hypothetical protein IPO00_01860 [Betaproteobacteria bacterium]|nr:hypothetical protein [Betaproteobacteria bacterium]
MAGSGATAGTLSSKGESLRPLAASDTTATGGWLAGAAEGALGDGLDVSTGGMTATAESAVAVGSAGALAAFGSGSAGAGTVDTRSPRPEGLPAR